MQKFQKYGINVLRSWGQWDAGRGYVDSCSECSLYRADGSLRAQHVARLKEIVTDADKLGIVIELVLFAQESRNAKTTLGKDQADRAVAALTREMLSHRNVTFQIWNESSERVLDHFNTIKAIDPKRLVSNSPSVLDNPGITNNWAVTSSITMTCSRPAMGRPLCHRAASPTRSSTHITGPCLNSSPNASAINR